MNTGEVPVKPGIPSLFSLSADPGTPAVFNGSLHITTESVSGVARDEAKIILILEHASNLRARCVTDQVPYKSKLALSMTTPGPMVLETVTLRR